MDTSKRLLDYLGDFFFGVTIGAAIAGIISCLILLINLFGA